MLPKVAGQIGSGIIGHRILRERVCFHSAINYHEQNGVPVLRLPPPRACPYCETLQLCCLCGKTNLPPFPVP